ncbi:MAG: MBL fold metallo-hydrolase [Rhodospirillaceae bacterium]|nr:MBL fold metallo-hydrolase [Rhodospirillaceae bacterium]
MTSPLVKAFFDPATYTVTYLVSDSATKSTAIIDPVLDFDPKSGRTTTKSADEVISYVQAEGLKVEWILETHVHADHLTAAPYIKEKLGGKIAIGAKVPLVQETFKKLFNENSQFATDGSQFDALLSKGDVIKIGNIEGSVMETPGHTPACVTYVFGDAAFVGDTMFMPDFGTARCDFPGGDAETLYNSIHAIMDMPDETRIFTCHDYLAEGRDEYAWESTVGEQKAKNVHINKNISKDEFVKMRSEKDKTLNMPVLILQSVQVNMRAGHMPTPEANGISYLKIPVNGV